MRRCKDRRLPVSIDGEAVVNTIGGYTVIVVQKPDEPGTVSVGLAFCSPKDRVEGKFNRDFGVNLAYHRAQEIPIQSRYILGVQEALLLAVVCKHKYVPVALEARVFQLLAEL